MYDAYNCKEIGIKLNGEIKVLLQKNQSADYIEESLKLLCNSITKSNKAKN